MAANKTVETEFSVEEYLGNIKETKKREDCTLLVRLLKKETGLKPKMWGTSIVGFGTYHYKYESGREGDAPLVGLSSRAKGIVLYLDSNSATGEKLLKDLGKYEKSKGCLYIKQASDINTSI